MKTTFKQIEAFINGLEQLNLDQFGCYYRLDSIRQVVFTFPHYQDENKDNIDSFIAYLKPLMSKYLPGCSVQSVFLNENVYCTPLQITFPVIKSRLTREQRYLKDPDRCPYCKRKDICDIPGMIYSENNILHQRIKCNKCGGEWIDHYTLSSVTLKNKQQ